jgi:hypothetical protein
VAICEANREARTRVEAIVSDGEERIAGEAMDELEREMKRRWRR